MKMLVLGLLLAALSPAQKVDVVLEGARLQRFLRSKAASESGRSVCWRVPSKTFSKPLRSRRGHDLFVHKGVGLVIGSRAADLLEIRRRGGIAVVRGRVFRVPQKRRRKGDPAYAIDVREIRRRRK
ncbi:MAG: hypothetical protein CMJ83_13125 [Planctomycetes bacterium]|nr:hypothetical protein [Planctomycetota bacterium]